MGLSINRFFKVIGIVFTSLLFPLISCNHAHTDPEGICLCTHCFHNNKASDCNILFLHAKMFSIAFSPMQY